jgi:site-specific DNA recombinase
MKTIGYVRVCTDKQADRGVSLEAQAEKIRAMAVVHNAELLTSSSMEVSPPRA